VTRLFLGLDGGQSGTTAVIGDEQGCVLGRGQAGPCHLPSAIRDAVAAAAREAGLEPGRVRFLSACLGFSGGAAGKRAIVERVVTAEHLILTSDAAIALTGATGGEPGIVTIAGTGSIAFGRNAEGRTARAGGWGHLFGDEGGAFGLVRQALRAALRCEEGWGPATKLLEKLTQATGTASANDLLHLFYTTPRDRIASFAPLVEQAAAQGDEAARQILDEAAGQLAALTCAVQEQLFTPGESPLVAWSGGAFSSPLLLGCYRARVKAVPPLHSPAVGALIEALRVLRSQF
jgi:N-acetylglucosamine kinase-like BadF-type ATPase